MTATRRSGRSSQSGCVIQTGLDRSRSVANSALTQRQETTNVLDASGLDVAELEALKWALKATVGLKPDQPRANPLEAGPDMPDKAAIVSTLSHQA